MGLDCSLRILSWAQDSSWPCSTADSDILLIAPGLHLGEQHCQGPEPPFPAGRYTVYGTVDFTPGPQRWKRKGKKRAPENGHRGGLRPSHRHHVPRPKNVV